MSDTTSRHVRVPDNLWYAAQDEAVVQGESVTAVIIRALVDYTGVEPERHASGQTLEAIRRRNARQEASS